MITMGIKEALKVRKAKKAKQPKFVRHAAHRKKKLQKKSMWRRPKGLQNKLRLGKKSRGSAVAVGYRSPAAVRGRSPQGRKVLMIATKRELLAAEPDVHDIIVSGKLGAKKRLTLIQEATKQGFTILNFDASAKQAELEAQFKRRLKARDARESKKSAREKELTKKAEKKAAEEKAEKEKPAKAAGEDETLEAAEERRKKELKEQQKILTKRGNN